MEPRRYTAVTVDQETKERIDRISAATATSRAKTVRDAIKAYEMTGRIRVKLASTNNPTLEVRA